MMISTKGRYALRVMIDLAEHYSGDYVPMKDIAKRQEISLKYVERILPEFKKQGLIETVHGKGGGYRLCREPDQYTAWEILLLAEGDLAPVSCLQKDARPCPRAAECKTLPLWKNYYELTKDYFSRITLADLMRETAEYNYVI